MYTEILVRAEVKPDIPDNARKILECLFNGEPAPSELPDHPFFATARWREIGSGAGGYHIPWFTSRYARNHVFSRSDLKNHNNEIDLFFDWLLPYLEGEPGTVVGYSWYEEALEPALVRLPGRGHKAS